MKKLYKITYERNDEFSWVEYNFGNKIEITTWYVYLMVNTRYTNPRLVKDPIKEILNNKQPKIYSSSGERLNYLDVFNYFENHTKYKR